MESISTETLLNVFAHIEISDAKTSRLVCARFRDILSPSLFQRLHFLWGESEGQTALGRLLVFSQQPASSYTAQLDIEICQTARIGQNHALMVTDVNDEGLQSLLALLGQITSLRIANGTRAGSLLPIPSLIGVVLGGVKESLTSLTISGSQIIKFFPEGIVDVKDVNEPIFPLLESIMVRRIEDDASDEDVNCTCLFSFVDAHLEKLQFWQCQVDHCSLRDWDRIASHGGAGQWMVNQDDHAGFRRTSKSNPRIMNIVTRLRKLGTVTALQAEFMNPHPHGYGYTWLRKGSERAFAATHL